MPIAAFVASDDPWVSAEDARAWSVHSSASFSVIEYVGHHFPALQESELVLRTVEATMGEWS